MDKAVPNPTAHRARRLHPAAFVGLLGLLSSLGPASFDIYLPGMPELARDLGAPQWMAQVTVATYFLGLAGGQLLAGPVSDLYGRRRPLLVFLGLFTVTALACALSPTVEALAGARFLQGATAAAGMVIARAVIRDLHAGADGARLLSRIVMVYGLAPVLAPMIGSQVMLASSWRGIFVVLAAFALLLATATACLLPETLPRERRGAGFRHVRADVALLLRDRAFVAYALVVGFSGAALASYLSASPFVIQGVYGASPQAFGLLYGVLAAAIIVSSQLNAHLLGRFTPERLLGWGVGISCLDGVAMLALAGAGAPLWSLCVTFFVLMGTWGLIPTNAVALAMLDHPDRAGTASALVGLFQYSLPALAMPLVGLTGGDSAVSMAAAVLFASALGLLTLRLLVSERVPLPALGDTEGEDVPPVCWTTNRSRSPA